MRGRGGGSESEAPLELRCRLDTCGETSDALLEFLRIGRHLDRSSALLDFRRIGFDMMGIGLPESGM